MHVVPKLRNVFNLRSSLAFPTTRLQSFHATSVCNETWKNYRNSGIKGGQPPSKNYIRYVTRKKRADAKRALRDLVYNNDAYADGFQNKEMLRKIEGRNSSDEESEDDPEKSSKKHKSKLQSRRAQKAKSKMKRNRRKEYFCDEDDDPAETIFRAAFGSKFYTWSFNSYDGFSHSSSSRFEWRENAHSKEEYYNRYNKTEFESNDETVSSSSTVGSHSDRTLLGLPPYGPINLADVKNAFRLSALKWHPDKHQGASQTDAEERFKLCVKAYNTLRSSVSAA